jgi:hypothetical protein
VCIRSPNCLCEYPGYELWHRSSSNRLQGRISSLVFTELSKPLASLCWRVRGPGSLCFGGWNFVLFPASGIPCEHRALHKNESFSFYQVSYFQLSLAIFHFLVCNYGNKIKWHSVKFILRINLGGWPCLWWRSNAKILRIEKDIKLILIIFFKMILKII